MVVVPRSIAMPNPSRGVKANTESSVRIAASHWASSICQIAFRPPATGQPPAFGQFRRGEPLLLLLGDRQRPGQHLDLAAFAPPAARRTETRPHAQTARPARASRASPAAPCPAAIVRYGPNRSWRGNGLSAIQLRAGQIRDRGGLIRANSLRPQMDSDGHRSKAPWAAILQGKNPGNSPFPQPVPGFRALWWL